MITNIDESVPSIAHPKKNILNITFTVITKGLQYEKKDLKQTLRLIARIIISLSIDQLTRRDSQKALYSWLIQLS